MKIYLIYTQTDLLSKSVLYSIPDFYRLPKDKDIILYAYTDKKKIKNAFLKERKNIFLVKEVKIDKEEYESYEKDFKKYKLSYYLFKDFNVKTKILCTYFEYVQVHEYWFDDMINEESFSYLGMDVICSFKNKYIQALKTLGLNSIIFVHDDIDGERDMFHEVEYSNDYSRVHILHESNPYDTKIYSSFDISVKDMNLFIHKYKELFKE